MTPTTERIRALRHKASELCERCDALAMEHRNLAAALDNFMIEALELVEARFPPPTHVAAIAERDGFPDG